MNRPLFLYLIIILSSCKGESDYLQVTNFYSEDPESPKIAVKVNNLGEVYFCIQRNPQFAFPGEEKFIFDYYRWNNKLNWNNLKNEFNKKFRGGNSIREKLYLHPAIALSYKLGDTLGTIDSFKYPHNQEEDFVYDLIDLIDTTNSRKIDYYPFNIELLAKPLPLPPKEE